MVMPDQISVLRRMHRAGCKIRSLAKRFNLSRNTVRRVLREEKTEFTYAPRKTQSHPRLGEYHGKLEELLRDDQTKQSRDRRNSRQLYEELRSEGYEGGYDSVRRFAHRWKEQTHPGPKVSPCVPLSFQPGEAFQFDWSSETVMVNGVPMRVQVAHMVLCHSRMSFLWVYARQLQEMMLDAHVKAFDFFGGVCDRGIYDNMKTAVQKILRGKERNLQRRFQALAHHYLYTPDICTPGAGWEKGRVERNVSTARTRLFTPSRKAESLAALNEQLRLDCEADAQRRTHPEIPGKTIWEVFLEERERLHPLPRTLFGAYAEKETTVKVNCLVLYDRNWYSAECRTAGHEVQIRAYAEQIEIIHRGVVVGRHERSMDDGRRIFEPLHYIDILERKPGALRNGEPFTTWVLPAPITDMWQLLRERCPKTWDREMADILGTIPHHGLAAVANACAAALQEGTLGKDVVLNLLSRLDAPPLPPPLTIPEGLCSPSAPVADCSRYDTLLGGSHAS